jgi:hypothetical protein
MKHGGHIVDYVEARERTIPIDGHSNDCAAKVFYLLGYCDLEGYHVLLRYSEPYGVSRKIVRELLDSKGGTHIWKEMPDDMNVIELTNGTATMLWLHHKVHNMRIAGHYVVLTKHDDVLYVVDPQHSIGLSELKYGETSYFDGFDLTQSSYLIGSTDDDPFLSASEIDQLLQERPRSNLPSIFKGVMVPRPDEISAHPPIIDGNTVHWLTARVRQLPKPEPNPEQLQLTDPEDIYSGGKRKTRKRKLKYRDKL